ncbi:methyl farnesoate epoxidase isoform X1 [Procambarus clarkii]|uniref:methyl farnesoate epoxidase isoform X1 n=2 Tax=Procambarus clarkii TaxID=6728 RepID=UPI003742487B
MLAILVVTIVLCCLYLASRKPRGFPPGPARLPLLGYLPFMEPKHPHKQLWRLSSTYGPVVGLFFGNQPTVIVNGWHAVKEALLNDDLNGRPENPFIKLRDGGEYTGVMFTQHDLWKEQRRFTLHHLRNLGVGKRSHQTIIHEEAQDLISEIQEADHSVNLKEMLGVSSINILWAVMGGSRFPPHHPVLLKLVQDLTFMFRAGEATGGVVSVFPALRHLLPKSSTFHVVMDVMFSVRDFIKRSVQEHRETLDPHSPRDFMDIYINEINNTCHNSHNTFTEKQLAGLCMDLFTAGSDSNSTTLCFAVLLATLHPEALAALHHELDRVVGHACLPGLDHRAKLVYVEATLMEVHRMRAVTPICVPHCALRDTTLQGRRIPEGTTVLCNLYSVHMDQDYWGDPDTFRPERFVNPDGSLRRDERLISFGKGRRMCLGKPLARMTTFLLFSALMQRFTFSLDPEVPVPDTEGKLGFVLLPPEFKVFARSRF